jgi:hypothetical protein
MRPTSRSKSGIAKPIAVFAAFILLSVAYLLSIGPAFRACYHGYLPFVIMKAYIPVALVGAAVPPIEKLVDDYIEWWKD